MHVSDPAFMSRGVSSSELSDEVVAVVSAMVVDASGIRVPTAANLVSFSVEGATVTILGTGSGDPSDHTPDHSSSRPTFHGLVATLISAKTVDGSFVVKAEAQGIEGAELKVGWA